MTQMPVGIDPLVTESDSNGKLMLSHLIWSQSVTAPKEIVAELQLATSYHVVDIFQINSVEAIALFIRGCLRVSLSSVR